MKKIVILLFFSLSFLLTPVEVNADLINVQSETFSEVSGGTAMNNLSKNITKMAKSINKASSQMMNFASMLYCNSLHGKAAEWALEIDGKEWFTRKVISIELFLSSIILTIIGFLILVATAFYMFDVAFNLSLSIVLLPLAIALWPFGWTRSKLRDVVESIAYYTGVFIFLPLGIVIANAIVLDAVADAFGGAEELKSAFQEDKADLIQESLAFYRLPFLKVLLCYILALKIIPLMAGEFCSRFFGDALAGSPISEKITQQLSKLNQKTLGRVGKYGKDVIKHQTGHAIQSMGKEKGNFLQRTTFNLGKIIGKTK
ncbi:MAG: hypothetical protein E7005_05450 [Alphaproteobacteria bacterium]|nr:hypothetical protein [Alphaproteobacteria bacterium]